MPAPRQGPEPLSNAQRQKRRRDKQREEIERLRAEVAALKAELERHLSSARIRISA